MKEKNASSLKDEEKVKVTVVTVTYNLVNAGRAEMFRQCIESVHSQSYPHIEHIVIDGASTDGTLDLIQEYADKGWITFLSEKDTGIYNAMNKGICRATGKYISFLNSDDFYCNQEAVSLSVKALEENNADFSFGRTFLLKSNKETKKITKPQIYKFWTRMSLCHQTIFCKTKKVKELGLFDETFKIAGDFHLMLRMLARFSKFVEVPHVLTTFRLGGFSAVNISATHQEAERAIYKAMREVVPVSQKEVTRIYASKVIPFRYLFRLVKDYPLSIRWGFYRNNINCFLKNIKRCIFICHLGKNRRHIKILFLDLLRD